MMLKQEKRTRVDRLSTHQFEKFNGRRDWAYITTDNVLIYHDGLKWTRSFYKGQDLHLPNVFHLAMNATPGLFRSISYVSKQEARNNKLNKKIVKQGLKKARRDKFACEMQAGDERTGWFSKLIGDINVNLHSDSAERIYDGLSEMMAGIKEKVGDFVSGTSKTVDYVVNKTQICIDILLSLFKAWASGFKPAVIIADIFQIILHHGIKIPGLAMSSISEKLTPLMQTITYYFSKGSKFLSKLLGGVEKVAEDIEEEVNENQGQAEMQNDEEEAPEVQEAKEQQFSEKAYKLFKEYAPAETQELLEALVAVLTTIFGITLISKLPGKNDFAGITKKIVGLTALWKSGGTLFDMFKTCYTVISDWATMKFLGIDMSAKRIGQIIEGAEKVVVDMKELILEPDVKDRVRNEPELAERVTSIYHRAITLYSTLLRRTGVPTSMGILIKDLIAKIEPIYASVDLSGRFNKANRIEPLIVKFFGTSGVGKSALTYPVVVDVLANALPNMDGDVRNQIYNRNVAQEYWDGYAGQYAVVYDDFGQTRDTEAKPNLEYMEIIRMQNLATFDLHMAHLENKGKSTFCSKMVVCSSNSLVHNIKSLVEPSAVNRRFDFVIGVEPHKDFTKEVPLPNGSTQLRMDTEKIEAAVQKEILEGKRQPCEKVMMEAYEFVRYDADTSTRMKWTLIEDGKERTVERIDYKQLRRILITGLKDKELKCGALREQLDLIAQRAQAEQERLNVKNEAVQPADNFSNYKVTTDVGLFQAHLYDRIGQAAPDSELGKYIVHCKQGTHRIFYCYPINDFIKKTIADGYSSQPAYGTRDIANNPRFHLVPYLGSGMEVIHNLECNTDECCSDWETETLASFVTTNSEAECQGIFDKIKTKHAPEEKINVEQPENYNEEERIEVFKRMDARLNVLHHEQFPELLLKDKLNKHITEPEFIQSINKKRILEVKTKLSPSLEFAKCLEHVMHKATSDESRHANVNILLNLICNSHGKMYLVPGSDVLLSGRRIHRCLMMTLMGEAEKKQEDEQLEKTTIDGKTITFRKSSYNFFVPVLPLNRQVRAELIESISDLLEVEYHKRGYVKDANLTIDQLEEAEDMAIDNFYKIMSDNHLNIYMFNTMLTLDNVGYVSLNNCRAALCAKEVTKFKERMETSPCKTLDKIMGYLFLVLGSILAGVALGGAALAGIYILKLPIRICSFLYNKLVGNKVESETGFNEFNEAQKRALRAYARGDLRPLRALNEQERSEILHLLKFAKKETKNIYEAYNATASVVKPEGMIDSQQCNIINSINRNICKLTIEKRDNEGAYYVNGIVLCGQTILTNKHVLPHLRESKRVVCSFLEARNGELKFHFDTCDSAGIPTYRTEVLTNAAGEEIDAMLLTMPGHIASFPTIVKHFVDRKFHEKASSRDATMIIPKHTRNLPDNRPDRNSPMTAHVYHSNMVYEGRHVQQMYSTSKDTGITTYQNLKDYYKHRIDTVGGDCGSPLLVRDPREQKKIVGIHSAGMNDQCYNLAQSLCREDIEAALQRLPTENTVQLDMDKLITPVEMQNLNMPKGQFIPYGIHNEKYTGGTETSLKLTKIAGKIWPVNKKPAYLKPTTINGERVDILPHNLKKCGMPSVHLDEQYVFDAGEDYYRIMSINTQQQYKRVLTNEEAIAGIEGDPLINGVNRKSSAGFGWSKKVGSTKGKKKWMGEEAEYVTNNPELLQEISDREEMALKNQRYPTVFVDTLKDEKRPIEKVEQGKTRAFSAGPMGFTVTFRKYFGGFLANHMANRITNESAVGIDPSSTEWNTLAHKLLSKGHHVIAGDYSNFDGTLCRQILKECLRLINQWYNGTDSETQIRNVLFEEICSSIHICKDIVYGWTHSLPSGNPATAILNSMYNSISMRMVYQYCINLALRSGELDVEKSHLMGEFNKHVTMIAYGDDNVINMSDEVVEFFNQETISEKYKLLGMTYTDESKSDGIVPKSRTLPNVSFLKRGFRWEEMTGTFQAPLEMDSTLGMLNFYHKGGMNETSCVSQIIESAMMNLFQHGREVFETNMKKITSVFNDNYTILNHTEAPNLKTYNQLLASYLHQDAIFGRSDLDMSDEY